MKYLSLLFLLVISCGSLPENDSQNTANETVSKKKVDKPGYKVNHLRYVLSSPQKTKIKVSLWDQKAWLLNKKGKVILETDISTGVDGKLTMPGNYRVLERLETKRSNLYGQYVDKTSGEVVIEKSWLHKGKLPKDTVYRGIAMPYWMRLTWDGVGMHVGGFEKRVRSSFGCIRVYEKAQPYIFRKTQLGTPVEMVAGSLQNDISGN